MIQKFETLQKASKENVDAALKAFGATSKGVQTIAVEATDYAKKSFEAGTAVIEKLAGVKTFDKALEIQAEYVKTSFEGAVAQLTKMGELYAALAKDAYKPVEGIVAKAAPAAAAVVAAATKQAA
ncbi:phasin family protein [Bosea sp. 2YAB26]|uniref:phasin family protein n=1 Tax=Bosea sp. 2YAB26 TaxID=3237478 RepID=UPI003F8F476F